MPSELTPIVPSETYGDTTGIEDIYGADNVDAWANIDNDMTADEIAARKVRASNYAYRVINSYLRGSELDAPATEASFGDNFGLLADIENELAGAWLYSHRGAADIPQDQQTETFAGQMQGHWNHAIRELERLTGIIVSADEDTEGVGEIGFVEIERDLGACEDDEVDEHAA